MKRCTAGGSPCTCTSLGEFVEAQDGVLVQTRRDTLALEEEGEGEEEEEEEGEEESEEEEGEEADEDE